MSIGKIQFAMLSVFSVLTSYGQTTTKWYGRIDVEITKERYPKSVYATAEIKTAFPGGDSIWLRSFEKQLNESLTIDKHARYGKFTVAAVFVVLKDSSLAEIRCLIDPGFGMGASVIRVLKKGTVRWKPGDGPVQVYPYRGSAVSSTDRSTYRRK